MSLVKFSYSEYENEPRYWEVTDATFSNVNLIVGKNSSGKSRLMSGINTFARLLSGRQKLIPHEPSHFSSIIRLNNKEFFYEIEFKDGAVSREILKVDKEEKLSRSEDGTGAILYEEENKTLPFKLPPDAIAAVNYRDELQHPFLIDLHQWASSVVIYSFGSNLGQFEPLGKSVVESLFNNPTTPVFVDPNNLVRVYLSAFSKFGEDFNKVIIADMNALGYSLKNIGIEEQQTLIRMFTVETDLDFKNPQMQMSQGMFRAFAIVVHFNGCAFSKNKQLILVDDIGEGLDYERATAIIDLLISKAKAKDSDMQLIMTSNDRFVMNKVPLEYWSVLKRKGGVVKLFNAQNSPKHFEEFKYLGLNNFDFFASDFLEAEINDD